MMRGFAQVQAAIAATAVCMVCTKKLLIANTAGYRQPVRGEVVIAETHCACAPRVDLPHGGPAYQLPSAADQLQALNNRRILRAAVEKYARAYEAYVSADPFAMSREAHDRITGEFEDAMRSLATTVTNQQLGYDWTTPQLITTTKEA